MNIYATLNYMCVNVNETTGILTFTPISGEYATYPMENYTSNGNKIPIDAKVINGYTVIDGYQHVEYDFSDDIKNGGYPEEKVFVFFYITNAFAAKLQNRNRTLLTTWENFYGTTPIFTDNVGEIESLKVSYYLEEKELSVPINYQLNSYNLEAGMDPFNFYVMETTKNSDGTETTTPVLLEDSDIVSCSAHVPFVCKFKRTKVTFTTTTNNQPEVFLFNGFIDKLQIKNILRSIRLGHTTSFMITNTSLDSKGTNSVKTVDCLNNTLVYTDYLFLYVEHTDNSFILGKNCENVTITEKYDTETKETTKNCVVSLFKDNTSLFKTTVPEVGDNIKVLNSYISQADGVWYTITGIEYELLPVKKPLNFVLGEKLLDFKRALKRSIIKEATDKQKSTIEQNEDYNKKISKTLSVKVNNEIKKLDADYAKMIGERQTQTMQDKRSILALANYMAKLITQMNVVNKSIAHQHNILLAKAAPNMALISEDAFKVTATYDANKIPTTLGEDSLNAYIKQIEAGTYINPWR